MIFCYGKRDIGENTVHRESEPSEPCGKASAPGEAMLASDIGSSVTGHPSHHPWRWPWRPRGARPGHLVAVTFKCAWEQQHPPLLGAFTWHLSMDSGFSTTGRCSSHRPGSLKGGGLRGPVCKLRAGDPREAPSEISRGADGLACECQLPLVS